MIVLLERVATFGYFIPTMVCLQRDTALPEPVVRARVSRWLVLNYIRNAAYLAAWVAAVLALRPRPATVSDRPVRQLVQRMELEL